MLVIVGWVIVIISILAGYLGEGGHMAALAQPFELLIIGGSAIGTFIVANNVSIIKATVASVSAAFKGSKYKKEDYIELLSLMYAIFKLAKTKGMLAIESHVERPEESSLFQQFPNFAAQHHAVEFLCDYLRMMTLGTDNPNEMETLIDSEIDAHHSDALLPSSAVQTVADAAPALGIVAAVMGVVITMGSITEPPEVLGHLIGSALVGTFLGVLISYGFLGPLSGAMKNTTDADSRYFHCMKAGLIAHMQGYAPAVSVEFARKVLSEVVRPTFYEVEEAVAALPPV
ncbi:MAG: flagellar motor stator protein MotA [Proteobacteria bacterium]|nr:flagellar motor stator protein MotA [Pseudomonadota bacterium]MBI3497817.1 flagellar motor stator protein MotA [Pseudomonadota bacterium]